MHSVQRAGVTTVDATFYGLREYHDRFAARKGDFDFLLEIIRCAALLGLNTQASFVALEDNKQQLPGLLDLLASLGCTSVHGFIQDFRGNGAKLDGKRLTKESYDALPLMVKEKISVSRHKTEAQWLSGSSFSAPENRRLVLALRPDNIDMLEAMSCDQIIDYLLELDDNYHRLLPDISVLAKQYGDNCGTKLYRQRDLWWKWSKAYISDHQLALQDITDERNCGALRY